ncbi:hypothetical protein FE257_008770 [Aspergillus nanangensis]|uniref:Uncharacterized protein n=1 Tax=Aspergillus nanangensis TaxID=2582783 RepID=A0AAD4CL54_ASPNN|nr:hypothetical protein FE257_008770 [Aspergillus nanangensis]
MSKSNNGVKGKATIAFLSAFLVLALTLVLLSPLDYLLPILPFTSYQTPCLASSSWSHPDRIHSRVFDPNHDLERQTFESITLVQDQLSWEDMLMPVTGGGILAQRSPPPDLADDGEIGDNEDDEKNDPEISYGISMFHQLHCLIILRGIIFPETSHKKFNSTLLPHSGDPEMDQTHWAHCFDYIAQVGALIYLSITPYGMKNDDTIEQPRRTIMHGKTVFNVHGVGAEHQCRDSKRLWEISMDSRDKIDMWVWKNGIGAREFFKDDQHPQEDGVPDIYTKGMQ